MALAFFFQKFFASKGRVVVQFRAGAGQQIKQLPNFLCDALASAKVKSQGA